MDVVTYACAVGGGKVVTEYLESGGMTQHCFHDMGDEILREAPIFTQCCILACAGSIEIPKARMTHGCGLCIPMKSVLNHQFCFGVHALAM